MKAIVAALTVYLALLSAVLADKLPKDAVPLTQEEVQQLTADTTRHDGAVDWYFAADGSLVGLTGKPRNQLLKGNWEAKDNTACWGTQLSDCNSYWKSGKAVWALWSTRSDGTKVKDSDYWNYTKYAKLDKGNSIAKQVAKLQAAIDAEVAKIAALPMVQMTGAELAALIPNHRHKGKIVGGGNFDVSYDKDGNQIAGGKKTGSVLKADDTKWCSTTNGSVPYCVTLFKAGDLYVAKDPAGANIISSFSITVAK